MPFQRKNIRLAAQNYLGCGIYFVTICCEKRIDFFANHSFGFFILEQLRLQSKQHSFSLHAFCLMPDHLHFLAEGNSAQSNLLEFVSAFKQRTSVAQKNRSAGALWQSKFYDHILRAKKDVESVACYIWANPVRKHLCATAGEYPLSGSETLDWKNMHGQWIGWIPPWKTKSPL